MSPPLAELTTLRLGGPAARTVHARTEEELIAAVRQADAAGEPLLLVAGGSNLVVADAGFEGVVVRVLTSGIAEGAAPPPAPPGPAASDPGPAASDPGPAPDPRADPSARALLTVAAGEPWDGFVARCVAGGLAGVECLSGIPGSCGATPIQNVGAYGQDVAETVVAVRALDRRSGSVTTLSRDDCAFTYRSSAFKRDPSRWIVLGVTFSLDRDDGLAKPIRYAELARSLRVSVGARAPLADVRDAVLELRRGKGMVLAPDDPDTRSAGSFFTNPILSAAEFDALRARLDDAPPGWPEPDGRVKTSAAWLIEHAGFHRGYGRPAGIAISSKHTLALTNRGRGTATELLALAREIAAGVRDAFGIQLTPEPVFVGLPWP